MKKLLFATLAIVLAFTLSAVSTIAAVDRDLNKVVVSQGKAYTAFGGYIENPNYVDTGDVEFTDGIITTEPGYDASWYGFQISRAQEDAEEKLYYEVVIDLGAVTDGLADFIFHTENFISVGIDLPSKVEFFVSDNGTDFTSAGVGAVTGTVDDATATYNTVELLLDDAVSGRYVKTVITNGDMNMVFCSEIQVIQYTSEAPVESQPETTPPNTSDDIAIFLAIVAVSAAGLVVISRKRA
ncbi:MAG: hypothetical protein A2Y17_00165 [Clostridiales bacterium GWF2_38_85]|nr:MAG: hypothetical protein A2Y17_00165 [Clostridiales bacterium GWF2_38_85]HBL83874.1 hypothetical protein [Clostridiales bacterium]